MNYLGTLCAIFPLFRRQNSIFRNWAEVIATLEAVINLTLLNGVLATLLVLMVFFYIKIVSGVLTLVL